uniref:hypothetical protein n=1 Tax=Chryseobacterium sp. TaxID=1871047 RepID=UPI00321A69EC
GPSTNCPNGMLRKITSLIESGTDVSYQTEQSSLNEAFKQLLIDHTYSETYSENSLFNKTGNGTDLTLTFNNKSVGNGVKLNGQIKLKYPTTTFKYEKLPNSYDPKLIILKAELSIIETNLEMTNSGSSAISIPKCILATYNLPPLPVTIPITTPVGIFPLPIKFKQKIDFEILPFELNGKFNFKVIPTASATIGAKFTSSEGWSNLSNYNFTATTPSSFTYSDFLANGSVNAQLTIFNPKYSISPMFVDELKATLELPIKLNLKVQASQPNYSLKGTVDVKGGIEQKFFRNLQGNYSLTGNLFQTTILEGNWDNLIIGTWKTVSYIHCGIDEWLIPPGQVVQNNCGENIGSPVLCSMDDLMTFKDDFTAESSEGNTSCSPPNPPEYFTYSLNSNHTIITINYNGSTENANILQLDSNFLKLQYNNGDIETRKRQ